MNPTILAQESKPIRGCCGLLKGLAAAMVSRKQNLARKAAAKPCGSAV